MPEVLFIICAYSRGGAQAIRFQNIIPFLTNDYKVTVIQLGLEKAESKEERGFTLISVPMSRVGRILNPLSKKKSPQAVSKRYAFLGLINSGKVKSMIRKMIFPDTYLFETPRLKRTLSAVLTKNEFDSVVLSAFPFSVLRLAPFIKTAFPNVKVLYDIGDPFSYSALNGVFRNKLARLFEERYLKAVDSLVVTNEETRRYYSEAFQGLLSKDQVHVVLMGVPSMEYPDSNKRNNEAGSALSLVYAGQLYARLREPFNLYKAVLEKVESETPVLLNMYGQFNEQFVAGWDSKDRILLHGRVSNEDVFMAYFKAHAIVFIDNAFGIQTPGKIFEVICIGKPVLFISDNVSSHARRIVSNLSHVVVCENRKDSILGALDKLAKVPSLEPDALSSLRLKFSWKARSEEFGELLKN